MKLLRARVTNYKSIDDSEWVSLNDVTCLVGKNEAGKTAFLKALYKLSPIYNNNGSFNYIEDYPRKNLTVYKRTHDENPAVVVEGEFELTDSEVSAIEENYGKGVIESKLVRASKDYNNKRSWSVEINEPKALSHFISQVQIPEEVRQHIKGFNSISEIETYLNSLPDKSTVQELLDILKTKVRETVTNTIINDYLANYIPRFVYFDDYSLMEGEINIDQLMNKTESEYTGADRSFLGLLYLSKTSLEDFKATSNYEDLKSILEGNSNHISDEVFQYWSQNKNLEVEFDIDPTQKTHTILQIRIKNTRHRVSVPFDERSKGFVWFFSFFSYFSQIEDQYENIIILLDEPGLSLHAKAQEDFLTFINDRLAPKYQVVFTTHSPFMVPQNLDTVRTVEDVVTKTGELLGTKISDQVYKTNEDTRFPLQAALGYHITQSLFIGENTLLVEGPSDLIYLNWFSEILREQAKEYLNEKWVVCPVGGLDKVSSFVSLFGGNNLNVTIFVDYKVGDKGKIRSIKDRQLLEANAILTADSFVSGQTEADTEDLIGREAYFELVNSVYKFNAKEKLVASKPKTDQRVITEVEQHFKSLGKSFSHFLPAQYLNNTPHIKDSLPMLDEALVRFEELFKKINSNLRSK